MTTSNTTTSNTTITNVNWLPPVYVRVTLTVAMWRDYMAESYTPPATYIIFREPICVVTSASDRTTGSLDSPWFMGTNSFAEALTLAEQMARPADIHVWVDQQALRFHLFGNLTTDKTQLYLRPYYTLDFARAVMAAHASEVPDAIDRLLDDHPQEEATT